MSTACTATSQGVCIPTVAFATTVAFIPFAFIPISLVMHHSVSVGACAPHNVPPFHIIRHTRLHPQQENNLARLDSIAAASTATARPWSAGRAGLEVCVCGLIPLPCLGCGGHLHWTISSHTPMSTHLTPDTKNTHTHFLHTPTCW